MAKIFTQKFIVQLSQFKKELESLKTANANRAGTYSFSMIKNAIEAITIVENNNDANSLNNNNKKGELSLCIKMIDGDTGLFVPAIFDELSLEFAKRSLEFIKNLDTSNLLESGFASTLAKTFSFQKNKEQYTKYLEIQIKFFEFVQNSMKEGKLSKQLTEPIFEKIESLIDSINGKTDLKKLKTDYESVVKEAITEAEKFSISCIHCDAYENASEPIATATLFGNEKVSDAFSEGRGQQRIYELLLSYEVAINKALAKNDLIHKEEELSSVRKYLEENSNLENIKQLEKRIADSVNKLAKTIDVYKKGDHLYKNKDGLAKIGGFFQNAFSGPNIEKVKLLINLESDLYNMKRDDKELQFNFVVKLLNRVLLAIKKHDDFVGGADISLGQASTILDDLRTELCEILMDINKSNEPYIPNNLLKNHKEKLGEINYRKSTGPVNN